MIDWNNCPQDYIRRYEASRSALLRAYNYMVLVAYNAPPR